MFKTSKKLVTSGTSGIYRIFVRKENKEYSYIGVSKNIENRWATHKREIKKWMNDKSFFIECLKTFQVPQKEASTFKFVYFMILHNLTIDNLCFEILEERTWTIIEEVEPSEIKYIEKFNSEWLGFNGVHAKKFKYQLNFSLNIISQTEAQRVLYKEDQRQKARIDVSIKSNIKPMLWIFFNYINLLSISSIIEEKYHNYFLNGYEEWKSECTFILKKLIPISR